MEAKETAEDDDVSQVPSRDSTCNTESATEENEPVETESPAAEADDE